VAIDAVRVHVPARWAPILMYTVLRRSTRSATLNRQRSERGADATL